MQTAPRATPEQEQSIASYLGNKTLGGLAALGNFLDLPGSMARDVLAFRNPLDQILSPFSDAGRTSGRDLLRQYGVTGTKDTWGNFGAGLAAEIALDPLTYLTFGASALGKGGKAAKAIDILGDAKKVASVKAGRAVGRREARMTTTFDDLFQYAKASTPDVADRLDEFAKARGFKSGDAFLAKHGKDKLGGLAGFQLPFTGSTSPILTGDLSQTVASGLDTAGRVVADSPIGTAFKAMFHAPSGGAWTKEGQKLAEESYAKKAASVASMRRAFREKVAEPTSQLYSEWRTAMGPDDPLSASPKDFADFLETIGSVRGDVNEAYRIMRERGVQPTAQAASIPADLQNRLQSGAAGMTSLFDELRATATAHGSRIGDVADTELASYFPRSIDVNPARAAWDSAWGGRKYTLDADNMKHRADLTRDMPRVVVEDIARNFADKPQDIEAKYGRFLFDRSKWESLLKGDTPIPDYVPKGLDETLKAVRNVTKFDKDVMLKDLQDQLAKYKANHPGSTIGDFTEQDLADVLNSAKPLSVVPPWVDKKTRNSIEKLMEDQVKFDAFAADPEAAFTAIRKSQAERLAGVKSQYPRSTQEAFESGQNIYDSMQKSSFKYINQMERVIRNQRAIMDGFAANLSEEGVPLFRVVQKDGKEVVESAFQQAGFDDPEQAFAMFVKRSGLDPATAGELKISNEFIKAAKASLDSYKLPEHEARIRTFLKTATRVFKDNVTLLFPAFHGRNVTSGAFGMNGILAGVVHNVSDAADMGKAYEEAVNVLKDSQSEAGKKWLGELFDHNVPSYGHVAGDVDVLADQATGFGLPSRPWDTASATAKAKEHVAKNSLEGILSSAGVPLPDSVKAALGKIDKARTHHRTAIELGAQTAANIEFVNRSALYIYLRKKGYAASSAAEMVRKIHIDYGDVTPTERNLKLLFPFYSFTRGMGEQTAKALMERPGGPLGVAIRATSNMHNPDEQTPDHLAGTLAIPIGTAEDGTKKYLTGFGMPWEDPLSFLGGGIRGAGLEAMSRLNPLLKGPLEYSSGVSFFQSSPEGGRPIKDQDPTVGRLLSNITGRKDAYRIGEFPEAVLANSPITRYLTTARQLTDNRKSFLDKLLNFATGVRVADVSPGAQDAILRERLQAAMREIGGREFVRAYVPESSLATMSPSQRAAATEYQALLNTLADRAKARQGK